MIIAAGSDPGTTSGASGPPVRLIRHTGFVERIETMTDVSLGPMSVGPFEGLTEVQPPWYAGTTNHVRNP